MSKRLALAVSFFFVCLLQHHCLGQVAILAKKLDGTDKSLAELLMESIPEVPELAGVKVTDTEDAADGLIRLKGELRAESQRNKVEQEAKIIIDTLRTVDPPQIRWPYPQEPRVDASLMVVVGDPTAELHAAPSTIKVGASATLTWTATGRTATLDGENVPLSGTKVVTPNATTQYELVATGVSGATARDQATVTVEPSRRNVAPVATDDTGTTDEDGSVSIDVLANDTDADGDTLSVTRVSDPARGSARVNADGTIAYTPDANFNGTDEVTYTVSDGKPGGTATGTVTVVINPVNDDPQAGSDRSSTTKDTPVTIKVLANDTDVDGDELTVTAVTDPSNGTAEIVNAKEIKYTPDGDFEGTDSFEYSFDDGNGGTATGSVTVQVGSGSIQKDNLAAAQKPYSSAVQKSAPTPAVVQKAQGSAVQKAGPAIVQKAGAPLGSQPSGVMMADSSLIDYCQGVTKRCRGLFRRCGAAAMAAPSACDCTPCVPSQMGTAQVVHEYAAVTQPSVTVARYENPRPASVAVSRTVAYRPRTQPTLPAAPEITASQIAKSAVGPRPTQTGQFFVSLSSGPSAEPARPRPSDPELAAMLYGMGYHQYWQGDYVEAWNSCVRAINADASDARAWYYKAFCETKLGREIDAVDTLGRAVRLHVQNRSGSDKIHQALRRIQGPMRTKIETAVMQTRMELKRQPQPRVPVPVNPDSERLARR